MGREAVIKARVKACVRLVPVGWAGTCYDVDMSRGCRRGIYSHTNLEVSTVPPAQKLAQAVRVCVHVVAAVCRCGGGVCAVNAHCMWMTACG